MSLAKKIQNNLYSWLQSTLFARGCTLNRFSDQTGIGRSKLRSFDHPEKISSSASEMANLLALGEYGVPKLTPLKMLNVLMGSANEEGDYHPVVDDIARLVSDYPEFRLVQLRLLLEKPELLSLLLDHMNLIAKWNEKDKEGFSDFVKKPKAYYRVKEAINAALKYGCEGEFETVKFDGNYFRRSK